MNRRKTFFDTHVSYLLDTPLYLVSKLNGVITNAMYKGSDDKTLFFKKCGDDFVSMVKLPTWNCYILESKNYCITPSKAYARDLSVKYQKCFNS